MAESVTVKELKVCYRDIRPFSIKRDLLGRGADRGVIFEALGGVSFSVDEGEIFGITGRNGSGKTTLLRTIAGIFRPDAGTVDLHGHTASLLSLGAGFNNNLTGRRNIELSGLLLGFTKQQVVEKTDEIIAFSELGEFIDRPVRTYSSGMYSKLSFSIAAHLETDITLIDEVLSVGDEKFRKKSHRKMEELISDERRTVIMVSHSLQSLESLCGRVMWLDSGHVVETGDARGVISRYRDFMK